MSDLPDEIVERVTQAIAKVLYVDGTTSGDPVDGTDYMLARAALEASGWAEMREALEKAARFLEALDTAGEELLPHVAENVCAARAALAVREP